MWCELRGEDPNTPYPTVRRHEGPSVLDMSKDEYLAWKKEQPWYKRKHLRAVDEDAAADEEAV
jgi:hypothetical protein